MPLWYWSIHLSLIWSLRLVHVLSSFLCALPPYLVIQSCEVCVSPEYEVTFPFLLLHLQLEDLNNKKRKKVWSLSDYFTDHWNVFMISWIKRVSGQNCNLYLQSHHWWSLFHNHILELHLSHTDDGLFIDCLILQVYIYFPRLSVSRLCGLLPVNQTCRASMPEWRVWSIGESKYEVTLDPDSSTVFERSNLLTRQMHTQNQEKRI